MHKVYNLNKIFLNGEFVESKSGKSLDVTSPIDLEILGQVPASNKEDVDLAVEYADKAALDWKNTSYEERKQYVNKFLDYLDRYKEEITDTVTKELGAPISKSMSTHVSGNINEMRSLVEIADKFEFIDHREGYDLVKEPVGIVACVTPWNYPLGQITKKVVPALLTGNTVILKPSSQTPFTGIWVAKAIEASGLPKGVFALITGKGSDLGDILAEHPHINMVTFTGSTKVGKELGSKAVSNMKRITLELGGKSPAVVLEGADLDLALDKVLGILTSNAGQTCSALTRLLIPESMKEEIEEKLVEKVKEYKVGNPYENVDMGPTQSKNQFEKISKYVKAGLDEGATMLYGKEPTDMYIEPVIFTDVKNDMKIATDEIFGPVLSVITYRDVEEAIQISNDTKYGLSGAVFGPEDQAYKVAQRIKSGNVTVNAKEAVNNIPFGGYKYSGIGRENGLSGLEEFIELKSIILPVEKEA